MGSLKCIYFHSPPHHVFGWLRVTETSESKTLNKVEYFAKLSLRGKKNSASINHMKGKTNCSATENYMTKVTWEAKAMQPKIYENNVRGVCQVLNW